MSSMALNFFVKRTMISELDEALQEIKDRASNYTQKEQKIPVNFTLDDYHIVYAITPNLRQNDLYKTIAHTNHEKNKIQNFRELSYTTNIGQFTYLVKIEKPIEGMRQMAANIINLSIVTLLIVVLFLVVVNRYVLTRLWSPFYKSLEVMDRFQLNKQNDLDFPITSTEEFNYMNAILKRSTLKAGEDYVALKEFTENASHELQTPLAIIGSKLDLLIQDENLSEKQEEKIRSAYTALKRISQLNQSLLLSAKIGNQQFAEKSRISFKQKINEKLNQFQELWEEQIVVNANMEESFVLMNKDLNDTLINNLLSNATKHNVLNGSIRIQLIPGELSITNTGTNQALDSKKLFQRFYKSDQNSRGNGLGLSIIKQICDTSGITINYYYIENTHKFVLSWNYQHMENKNTWPFKP